MASSDDLMRTMPELIDMVGGRLELAARPSTCLRFSPGC
jgi:hypothetical protein